MEYTKRLSPGLQTEGYDSFVCVCVCDIVYISYQHSPCNLLHVCVYTGRNDNKDYMSWQVIRDQGLQL